MQLAKINARGRLTIPKSVREAVNLGAVDVIAFEIKGDHVVVRKVNEGKSDYMRDLPQVLSEWSSPQDEEAWGDL